ncbi:hypothetical protein [Bdellovibrio sp. HCB209]|uniref:hypothetical protein n=1 Tax=Bdellovibrio sp. HCB209 TaxID=3394354 RepID=UPI0039B4A95E
MRLFKGLIIFGGVLILALFAWFFHINGSFTSSNLKTESVNFGSLNSQERMLTRGCIGFTGLCEIPSVGIKIDASFKGFSFSKPSPGFLNISGWGDSRGIHWQETYFGYRKIRIIAINGKELGSFSQLLWNTGAYADLSQVLAVDLTQKKLFVAAGNFGFLGTTDIGWPVNLMDRY